jgi:uncharacterized protein
VIDAASRRRLLELARAAVTAEVQRLPPPVPPADGVFSRPAGAFVTIRRGGQLRGCIGHMETDEALGVVVARMAVAASSADPRFRAVGADELDGLSVEISVLGPLEPISGPDGVEAGRHGLLVEEGRRRGVLLPQVAVEHGWDAETFLSETCAKAGLPEDAWRRGARLWRFEAEVFGD